MRKLTVVAVLVLGLAGAAVAGENSMGAAPFVQPTPGVTEQTFVLTFNGPDDTFTFDVCKAWKAGDLTVSTMDCCVVGDCWRVDLNPVDPLYKDTYGIGDGTIDAFTGAATVHPWVRGTVTVSYDHGVDMWPAGMTVKFIYSNEKGMNITPQF